MSKDAALVIMAAGMGSRFGKGIKQLEPVGPNGEIIMDYSIYDATEAGFRKVIFVIRKSLEADFKEIIGRRIEKIVEVSYAYQEIEDVPEKFAEKAKNRKKPWGTGQAILACKKLIKEPFLVINADDYYGKEAFRKAYSYLMSEHMRTGVMEICMVGFTLGNTLSRNGAVTRGVCKVDEEHFLVDIEETYGVCEENGKASAKRNGEKITLPLDTPVSMNMWGLPVEFLDALEKGFEEFLESLGEDDMKEEYLLPQIIGCELKNARARVSVLSSGDRWFGVTYQEDKKEVVNELRHLIDRGVYPEKLYE